MHFVNVQRFGEMVPFGARGHPFGILPFVAAQRVVLRRGLRRAFGVEAVRVRLHQHPAVTGFDGVFVGIKPFPLADHALPDSLFGNFGHRGGGAVPCVEIPHYRHSRGVRRPDAEHGGIAPSSADGMCPQKLLTSIVGPLMKQVRGELDAFWIHRRHLLFLHFTRITLFIQDGPLI